MDLGQMVMSRVQTSRGVQLKCHALLDIVWILTPFKVPYPGLLRGAWKTESGTRVNRVELENTTDKET